MSIQEPAWLKRSRPCPFFSQGRCLFADACNFLHDVKVRSAVTQPLRTTVHVYHPPSPVFKPPFVVVDSASPPSVTLPTPASPAQDSSRYSGLLSVLSDVIGPPSELPITPPSPRLMSSIPYGCADLPSDSESTNTITEMEPEQRSSGHPEPPLIPEPDSEATLVDPFGYRMDSFVPETDGKHAAGFHPVTDSEEPGEGDAMCYVVEGTYIIGSDDEDEDMDDHGEDDPTVILSNRQSTLSSFTGASLLASPQHSVFGDPLVAGRIGDLLSPVQMSARLRPFPIPSLDSKVKRRDSIDSGYADGDSWVSPLPFPRSPPRSSQSFVAFLPCSRRGSLSSPARRERGVSYDQVGALRPSTRNLIEVIKEVESEDLEGDEDVAYTVLGVYDALGSEERGERRSCGFVQVHVTEEKVEEHKQSGVGCSPRRYSTEHLCPTRQYDLDLLDQPSFTSDDNLSFKTTLSTQPSYDDLSDTSRVSPVKQDSLLSYISGRSTPNTSVLSHYDDANEVLEQSIASLHVCESPRFDNGTATFKAGASEECPLPKEGNSNVYSVLVSASANGPQGYAPHKVVSSPGRLLISSPAVDTSHEPTFPKDILGHVPRGADELRKSVLEKAVTPQDRSPGFFHFDRQPPKSSPSADHFHGSAVSVPSTPATPDAESYLESVPESVATPGERASGFLRHARRSPKSSLSTSPYGPSLHQDVLGHAPVSASDDQGPARRKRLSSKHPSRPQPFTESPRNSSSLGNISRRAPLHTHGNDSVSQRLFPAAEGSQSLVVVDKLGSDETTEVFDCFPQRLSFPLPPPLLPTEMVGHSTLSGKEDASVSSEAVTADLEGDVSNACAVLQDEETEWMHSSYELTEKARPSHLPPVGSPNSSVDFTLRRNRAASDLTVRAEYVPGILSSPPPPLEPPGQANSVQSLYDQYFDDTSDDGPESSSFVRGGARFVQEPTKEGDLQSLGDVFQGVSSLSPGSELGLSGTDSPRSEIVLRPLLTGRRSFLRSSLAELIPKASLNNESPTFPPARLQAKEIGSTMVPLGFRRYKPRPAAVQSSSPLHTKLSAPQLREMLRIRTDIARGDQPSGCSSATNVSFTTRSPLPAKAMSAPPTGGLRQLRLSSIANKRSSILSTQSSSIASSILSLDQLFNSPTPQSPSVSSTTSFSRNSSRSPSYVQIPEHIHHPLKRSSSNSLILQARNDVSFASQSLNLHDSRSVSAPIQQPNSWHLSHYRAGSRNYLPADGTRCISRRTSTLSLPYAVDEEHEINEDDFTTPRSIQVEHTHDWAPALVPPVHAIATPKPNLLFAIASDDVEQVRQVLESGEAGPNDCVGPQSALAFTLTNDKLAHKQEIVKALLAYGANPAALRNPIFNPASRIEEGEGPSGPPPETTLEGMDPATRYFVSRADATHTRQTSQLIYRSFFRPLTRVRYDVIGQDWALEQLFRVLSMHSQKLAVAPIVVLLCGPSGHGKSLLARKFGSLLDVPTHTVNMTTLRSAHDIWQSYSMSPYEEPSSCTLAEFLIENEGKRCIVVLDEIEKVEDQKALWSLLMPWELGRCSLEAGTRHIDARNVVWLGTSNIGHELVFEHHENRAEPDKRMTREDYLELTTMLRPRVSDCLGASLVSRVTTVLPFVPFTTDEKKAIAAEAVYSLAGKTSLSPQDVESLVTKALPSYHPSEGARSLHRAISNILVDAI